MGWKMDIQPQSNNQISDDQELAKALAGITQPNDGVNFQADAMNQPISEDKPADDKSLDDKEETPKEPVQADTAPIVQPVANPEPVAPIVMPTTPPLDTSDLSDVKKDALNELKPLVDKLDLNDEEKFNIYLLLIRSTDDKSLIAPAHEAAKSIADETKRAQALLDIIKEIDYLSAPETKE